MKVVVAIDSFKGSLSSIEAEMPSKKASCAQKKMHRLL